MFHQSDKQFGRIYLLADACVDPESFVRGGPTLMFFLFFLFFKLMKGGRIKKTL